MRIDIDIPGPLHHTFEYGHQTLQTLDPHGLLLVGGGSKLQRSSSTSQLGEVIDQPLEYISSSCKEERQA